MPGISIGRGGGAAAGDLLGCFAVEDAGQIAPGSFQYNRNHLWFHPDSGVPGHLADRQFYAWLHDLPGPGHAG